MAAAAKVILIAEDNPDEVFIMSRVFGRCGLPFELRFVANGQEAINYLERKPPYESAEKYPCPSVIVLDLKMPLVNGFEVLAWLKLQPELSRIPAVVHSSSAVREDRERAGQLGARDYYVKGSAPGELVTMFKTIAEKWLNGTAPSTGAGFEWLDGPGLTTLEMRP